MDGDRNTSQREREPVVHNLHPSATVTLEDLRLLELKSVEQCRDILTKYAGLKFPREPIQVFQWRLTVDPQAWFIQVGEVGLVYLTNVEPSVNAELNVLFWDGKLGKDRQEAIKAVIGTAFRVFEIERISASVVHTNAPLRNILNHKLGFVLEGVTRRGARSGEGKFVDLIRYGLLKEELLPCQLITSLVPTT